MCDCSERAKSEGFQNKHPGESNKHRAGSPLASTAKRQKYSGVTSQPSGAMPEFSGLRDGSHASTNSMPLSNVPTDLTSTENWSFGMNTLLYPMDGAAASGWYNCSPNFNVAGLGAWINSDVSPWTETAGVTQGLDDSSLLLDMGLWAPCSNQMFSRSFVLTNSRPADFLAFRETSEFRDLESVLQTADINYPCNFTTLVTYNPVKETVTLTGASMTVVDKAYNRLQCLFNEFSKHWGGNYLMSSSNAVELESPTFQARLKQSSDVSNTGNSEFARVFPVRSKDHRQLVGLWFKSILPSLPKLLRPILGGTYTASLVRRGRNEFRAKPCIQIESPRTPGPGAQDMIRESLHRVFSQNEHSPIGIRFSQGSVKKLSGEMEDDGDNTGESADTQRFEFNLVRPFTKPGMGASIGLKCSKKVVATLGGYILVDGAKYLLTSEHFITKSQERENTDGDDSDLETLTSPSRFDLSWMEENLKQTKRDLDSEVDLLLREIYGDQDIQIDEITVQRLLKPDLSGKIRDVESLIRQVKRPPDEFAIGKVYRRSPEPQTFDGHLKAMCHLDWALCELDDRVAQVGENKHKYRSNEDAMADDYIEETAHMNQPGDACYETCDVADGVSVYYVGQRSKHRSGQVSIPSLVSRDNVETLDWGIMSSDGQVLPYTHFAGDSGAWVIRTNGNKLMGQVHSYSSGQVLFTPIDVIFADIAKLCEVHVALPPSPPGSGQPTTAATAIPLCSKPTTPPIQSLKFLKPTSNLSTIQPKILFEGDRYSETLPLKRTDLASRKPGVVSKDDWEDDWDVPVSPLAQRRIDELMKLAPHGLGIGVGSGNRVTEQRREESISLSEQSDSTVPSLTSSPRSSTEPPESPKSPLPLDLTNISDAQADEEQQQPVSPRIIEIHLSESAISSTAMDEKFGKDQTAQITIPAPHWNTNINLQAKAINRTTTWPITWRSTLRKQRQNSPRSLPRVFWKYGNLAMSPGVPDASLGNLPEAHMAENVMMCPS